MIENYTKFIEISITFFSYTTTPSVLNSNPFHLKEAYEKNYTR